MQSPSDFKIKKGFTKYSFRVAMQNKLPDEITWRKDKQGFINPQDEWIKNQLKDRILGDYFCKESEIFKLNIFNRNKLITRYLKFCDQKINRGTLLEKFYPLALEIWLQVIKNILTLFKYEKSMDITN